MFSHLWPDLRYGVRMLLRHPTLSVASILTFGLGIGLATSVFSIVNGVLLKGLPFEEGDRIVIVAGTDTARGERRAGVSVHDFAVFEQRQRVFDGIGAFRWVSANLSWDQRDAERFPGAALTVGALRALRVKPVVGRLFRDGEDRPGAEPVMLIGHRLWRDAFRGAPDAVGGTIIANGVARTIVGVMPERFGFPNLEQVWIPLVIDPLATPRGRGPEYEVVARLKSGVAIASAQAQMESIAAGLARDFPATNARLSVLVMPFMQRVFGQRIRILMTTMLGVGVGVLLVACVNVSNLLLARASLRRREVAIRQALGAGRRRVLAQLLTESSMLAAAGATLGVLINAAAMRWFVAATESTPPPFFVTFEPDSRVLLFVAAVTVLAGLAAGLVPAWRTMNLGATAALADESRGATGFRIGRLSGALVVVEIAVSCALLIAAGLMVKTVVRVKSTPLPFAVDGVLTAWIDLPRDRFPDGAGRSEAIDELVAKLDADPGVEAAAMADGLPADGSDADPIQVWGMDASRADEFPFARKGRVTPGYFRTFRVPVRQGRDFTALDRPDREMVAVVNESFRRRFLPSGDAIGRRFRQAPPEANHPWLTVVGVVPDLLMQGFRNDLDGGAGYYVPVAQAANGETFAIAVRGTAGAVVPAATLRTVVASLGKGLAVWSTQSMRAFVDQQAMFYQVFGVFFAGLGGAGLLLAAAGLYGVVSSSVARRTRELAIRAALGARRGRLMRLVMRAATTQTVAGLALGLALGLLATRPVGPFLYDVHPRDPAVLITVVVTLGATALAAGFLGVRRIVRLDPAAVLGEE